MTVHGHGCKGLDVARLLIEAGAVLNIKGCGEKPALDSAREYGCEKMAKLFE